MSRIDKLVSQAFPDELRNVEPMEVDEDAIFALTLEKLGLDHPAGAQPQPQRKQRGLFLWKRKERGPLRLVEFPPERPARHRWVNRLGGALAACLVLGCVLYWGPWLLNNLGFGTRAHSDGSVSSEPADGSVNGIWFDETVTPRPAPVTPPPESSEAEDDLRVLEGNASDIEVLPDFTFSSSGLNVSVRIRNASSAYYSVKASYKGKEMYCVARSYGDSEDRYVSTLHLTFLSEVEVSPNGEIDLLVELIPGLLPGGRLYQMENILTAAGFRLDLGGSTVVPFAEEDYQTYGYTVSEDKYIPAGADAAESEPE